MADTKISALPELAAPASGDFYPIVDNSGTATTKRVNHSVLASLASSMGGAIYNVQDYGAVADGVTDDTAAIQSAIDAAIGAFDSFQAGLIYFPPSANAYLVNGTIHVRHSSVCLRGGAGMYYGTEIKFDPDASAWVSPTSEGSQAVCVNFQHSWGFLGSASDDTGTATSSGSTTVMTDSGGGLSVPVGAVIVNRTTGAWGQVISSTATTVTHTALTGGTSTTWAAGDTYDVGAPPTYRGGFIENMQIISDDTTTDKLALRLWDCGETNVTMVNIRGFYGLNSTALRIYGRQHIVIEDSEFNGVIPARISRIPDASLSGANSYDNCFFRNVQLQCHTSAPTDGALVWAGLMIDGNAKIHRSAFRDMNIRGGQYAIYRNTPSGQTDQGFSQGILIENVHWEQTAANAVCNFYFNYDASGHDQLHFVNCSVRTKNSTGDGQAITGIHVKGVARVLIENLRQGVGAPESAAPLINVVSGVKELQWRNANIDVADTWVNGQSDLHCVHEVYDNPSTGVFSLMPVTAQYKRNAYKNMGGSPNTINKSDNFRHFVNGGAVATTVYNLPTSAGSDYLQFTFTRRNSQDMQIVPPSGQLIGEGGAGKYLSLDSDRCSVTVCCYPFSSNWCLLSASGTISYEP